ncbi:MAG: hypothetical protein ABGZ36_17890, partial [Actinomycetota bacterium]
MTTEDSTGSLSSRGHGMLAGGFASYIDAHVARQDDPGYVSLAIAENLQMFDLLGPRLESFPPVPPRVVGYDANSQPDAREWFVNQAEFNGIAKAMIDSLAAEKGEDASFGIVTSTFTTPNQARWIAEMQAYQEACYPDMEWLETLEAQEDAVLSFN